jgi:hypothetical protein
MNSYQYVENSPIDSTDPRGLKTFNCKTPLHAAPNLFRKAPLMYHEYICVVGTDGKPVCVGQDRAGSALWSPGIPSATPWRKEAANKWSLIINALSSAARFTGLEDEGTALQYYRARHYACYVYSGTGLSPHGRDIPPRSQQPYKSMASGARPVVPYNE